MSRDPLPTGRCFMEGAVTQSAQSEERKAGEVNKTGGRSDPLDRHEDTEDWNSGALRPTALALLIKRL